MVTASHNPIDYNGMKLVREGSRPISGDSGLGDIRRLAEYGEFQAGARQGTITEDLGKGDLHQPSAFVFQHITDEAASHCCQRRQRKRRTDY